MKGLFLYGVATKSEMVSHEFTKIPFSELVATTTCTKLHVLTLSPGLLFFPLYKKLIATNSRKYFLVN